MVHALEDVTSLRARERRTRRPENRARSADVTVTVNAALPAAKTAVRNLHDQMWFCSVC